MVSSAGLFLGRHALTPIKSYFYMDQKLSWADAQQHCRDLNGDLATVDHVADLQHLQESRSGFNYDNDFMWIGLYDDRTRWKWTLGDQDYKIGQNYGTWEGMIPEIFYNKGNCSAMLHTGNWFDTQMYYYFFVVNYVLGVQVKEDYRHTLIEQI